MYHYTESGLENVWLKSGYMIRKTPYGNGLSVQDVDGLHRAICNVIARRARLSSDQLRFLRKEMGMSQSALARLLGTSERNLSLWEGRGGIPKISDRLVKLICLEHIGADVKIRKLIDHLNEQDVKAQEKLRFEHDRTWKEAA
jgi:DNA-binding transcriptional regulator YiaG